MSAWRWLKGQAVCLAVMPYLLGGNVYSLGVQKYGCAELYLMAKAIGANAVHGGFAGCVSKFRSGFSCLSDAHGYRDPLQRSLCITALKLFLYPAPHSCHVLPPGVRQLFSEKL